MSVKKIILAGLFLTSACSAMGREVDREEVARSVKGEILENWNSEYYEKQHSYVLTSPAYPLEYDEGCVIYRQSFPELDGKVSFARMDFYRLYYATAFGSDCSKVDPGKFFMIQEGSDPYGTLDFVRRVYSGARVGRDEVKEKDIDRLGACFASDGKQAVDVSRAESRALADADGLQYLVVLRCQKLGPREEIFVSGFDRQDKISWEIRTSVQIDVNEN